MKNKIGIKFEIFKKVNAFGLYIFLILNFSFLISSSQDIHYSLFTQSPLTINPAQAGTTAWIRGVINYKNQWAGIPVPYTTIAASFDEKIKKRWHQREKKTRTLLFRSISESGIGWGVNLYNDEAGDGHIGTLQGNFALAYQLLLSKESMLAAGLQAGIVQRSITYSGLYWESQYDINAASGFDPGADPNEDFSSSHYMYPDVAAGMVYTYKKNERYMRGNDQKDLQFGAGVYHLNRPKYSFLGTEERIYPRLNIHASGIYGISNTNISLMPGILFSKQGPNREFLIGTLFRYMLKEDSKYTGYVKGATIAAGGYYRNKDAFVVAGIFEFSSYSIGVSYDINVSKLKTATDGRGGVEVVLRFLNPSPFLFSRASFNK